MGAGMGSTAVLKSQQKVCPACSVKLAAAAKFCTSCGARLENISKIETIDAVQAREEYLDSLSSFAKTVTVTAEDILQMEQTFQNIKKKELIKEELKKLFPVQNKYLNRHIVAVLNTLLSDEEMAKYIKEKLKTDRNNILFALDQYNEEVLSMLYEYFLNEKYVWGLIKILKAVSSKNIVLRNEMVLASIGLIEDEKFYDSLLSYCHQIKIKLSEKQINLLKDKYLFLVQKYF